MPPRTVKRGAGLAGPKRTTRGTRGAQKAQDPPPEEVAVLVAAPPKRSRNSSDIAGKRDLFDSLPDDLVISILRKLSSSTTYPSDFANVLLTCRRLNGLGLNFLVQIRQRIVNKIMETLKRHLPVSGQVGLHELRKIAIRFEEKICTAATSQSDYLRKISLKMLTMETKSQNPIGNALP